jgi:hypothetical protein
MGIFLPIPQIPFPPNQPTGAAYNARGKGGFGGENHTRPAVEMISEGLR